ncbi:MAG: cytidylate kinase-like family protein [Elusimicrobia bacterium]|nr:cytidylate kinase-like family protein [Elusimicrobiota bacterium]
MDIGKLTQYLSGMSRALATGDSEAPRHFPFVAISRQTGAGGHSLAEAILREMEKKADSDLFRGWQMFDEEICRKISANPKLKVLMDSLLAEKFRTGMEDLLTHAIAGVSSQDEVIGEIFRMFRDVARVGKCVLVGRGAASLLRRHPRGVFVRVIAPIEARTARMTIRLNADRETALTHIQQQDTDRTRLVRRYFDQDVGDPLLYDCVWNTGNVPIEVVARAVVALVEERARNASPIGL